MYKDYTVHNSMYKKCIRITQCTTPWTMFYVLSKLICTLSTLSIYDHKLLHTSFLVFKIRKIIVHELSIAVIQNVHTCNYQF